ncbi:MAG: hypothetical protein ACLRSW_07870 [Christensenellaceae bacterium]
MYISTARRFAVDQAAGNQLAFRCSMYHRGMELSAQGGKLIFSKVEQALYLLNEAGGHDRPAQYLGFGTIRIGA